MTLVWTQTIFDTFVKLLAITLFESKRTLKDSYTTFKAQSERWTNLKCLVVSLQSALQFKVLYNNIPVL